MAGVRDGQRVLVRPDGSVAFRGEPPDGAALEACLGELFSKAR